MLETMARSAAREPIGRLCDLLAADFTAVGIGIEPGATAVERYF
jgi:hypothetical protein